eukprot:Phypoly_transcript_12018.p1 GENE.Phypoly_transcript_12018~~Phypoly_transcript_12018.p1  ORF type:complete len:224 (+),score=39.78 Phypoly_transcript_12018:31-672(+)
MDTRRCWFDARANTSLKQANKQFKILKKLELENYCYNLQKRTDEFFEVQKMVKERKKRKLQELEQREIVLAQEIADYEAEKKMVTSKYIIKGPLRLNLGGIYFETTTTTLTNFPSMLGSMFSGRYVLEKGEDGAYFIDRDGTYFRHILNFMRDGQVPTTLRPNEVEALKSECKYYMLDSMTDALNSTYDSTGKNSSNNYTKEKSSSNNKRTRI